MICGHYESFLGIICLGIMLDPIVRIGDCGGKDAFGFGIWSLKVRQLVMRDIQVN